MKLQLDFNLLPDLSTGAIIRRLDPDVEPSLSRLPQTCARAKAAINFAHIMGLKEHTLAVRESYLWASITEYVSMEETLPRDLKVTGLSTRLLRANHSPNPLLHIVRELRNLEIHLRSSSMSVSQTDARSEEPGAPGEWREIRLNAWWIEPITEAEFAELRNARRYQAQDVTGMLDWFNDAQKVWGVDELVRLAVNAFVREIVLSL